MSLLDKIKAESQKAGQNKGKFIFFRPDEKVRVRFLNDMEEGMEIPFHDNFQEGVNVPCQELYGRDCPYCEQENLRTRSLYAWSVYDYEAKDVKIFMQAVNNCTAIPALMALYETYGTLTDRDFVITKTGKQQNTAFSVVPMDKNRFRNAKAKPFSEKAILKFLDAAYPADDENDDDDDYTSRKPKQPKMKSKAQTKSDEDEIDYSEMSARELYELCEDRGIECEPKMKAKYYIELLEEYDEENGADDWDDENDDDEVDYSELSAQELYRLCKERDIECKPKKSEKYYINLLEEDDQAHDDWDDDEEEEDEEDW